MREVGARRCRTEELTQGPSMAPSSATSRSSAPSPREFRKPRSLAITSASARWAAGRALRPPIFRRSRQRHDRSVGTPRRLDPHSSAALRLTASIGNRRPGLNGRVSPPHGEDGGSTPSGSPQKRKPRRGGTGGVFVALDGWGSGGLGSRPNPLVARHTDRVQAASILPNSDLAPPP